MDRYTVLRWKAGGTKGAWCVYDAALNVMVAESIRDEDQAHIIRDALEGHKEVLSCDEK